MNPEIKERYLGIVNEYKLKLDEFNSRLVNTPYECVFNSQLVDEELLSNDILGITVMDNPGVDEVANGEYLIGKAGKGFNKVINSLGIFRSNLLVFNKSAFHTPATNDLNELYGDGAIAKIFLEEKIVTFDIITRVFELLQVPLMIHGYTSYFKNGKRFIENHKSNRPLYKFFELLYNRYKDSSLNDKIYFYHHSSYGCLEKQLRDYLDDRDRSFEVFKELGKFNAKGFFD